MDGIACHRKVVESLIKAGVFDFLGHPRKGLYLVYGEAIERVMESKHPMDGVAHILACQADTPIASITDGTIANGTQVTDLAASIEVLVSPTTCAIVGVTSPTMGSCWSRPGSPRMTTGSP